MLLNFECVVVNLVRFSRFSALNGQAGRRVCARNGETGRKHFKVLVTAIIGRWLLLNSSISCRQKKMTFAWR